MTQRDMDPAFQRALQSARMNGNPPPQMQPQAPAWAIGGHCQKCGSPVWFNPSKFTEKDPPAACRVCPCPMTPQEQAEWDYAQHQHWLGLHNGAPQTAEPDRMDSPFAPTEE